MLAKYNPFLQGLQSELSEMFEGWTPRMDVWETENEIVMSAECPGLSPESLEITLENNVLTLKGTKEEERKGRYYQVERSYGTFSRSFTLPSVVDREKIDAEYKNGVVTVTMAKDEGAKARKIEIKNLEAPKAIGKGA